MGKPDTARHAPGEVDAYLAELPEDVRVELERVRGIIRNTAPDCTERVSYRIPIFRLRTDVVAISAHTNHCSLHCMSTSLLEALAEELTGFTVSGTSIHFTPVRPLPRALIETIVRERMKAAGG